MNSTCSFFLTQTNSVRILLALGAQTDYKIHTFDVNTAFFMAPEIKKIYMKIPEGYDEQGTGKVCLLKKALYGLRQAPQRWNKRLTDFLRSEGLIQVKNDQCIFKTADNNPAIHVDDGLIVAKNSVVVNRLLDGLGKEFQMKVTKEPFMYLGMQIYAKVSQVFF